VLLLLLPGITDTRPAVERLLPSAVLPCGHFPPFALLLLLLLLLLAPGSPAEAGRMQEGPPRAPQCCCSLPC
jgi:hypothetical protein